MITSILPTYKRPQLLKRALRSLLAQSYQEIVIKVYDNASGDETAEVVKSFAEKDARVEYYCRERNIGAFKNFDYAMREISTPYFHIMSDDDVVLPTFYENAIGILSIHGDASLCACMTAQVDEGGKVRTIPLARWKEGFYPPGEGLLPMIELGHPEWTGIVFRRKVLDEVGYLDPDVGLAADWDFELRVAAKHGIYVCKQLGAVFWRHQNAASWEWSVQDIWPGWLRISNKLMEHRHLGEVRNKAASAVRSHLQKRLQRIALRAIVCGDSKNFRESSDVLREEFKDIELSRALCLLQRGTNKSVFLRRFSQQSYELLNKIRSLRWKNMDFIYPEINDLLRIE
jgi:GT2 family glycosyltransferase